MTVKDTEKRDAISKVGVGDMGVLHRPTPALHTGGDISDLKRGS